MTRSAGKRSQLRSLQRAACVAIALVTLGCSASGTISVNTGASPASNPSQPPAPTQTAPRLVGASARSLLLQPSDLPKPYVVTVPNLGHSGAPDGIRVLDLAAEYFGTSTIQVVGTSGVTVYGSPAYASGGLEGRIQSDRATYGTHDVSAPQIGEDSQWVDQGGNRWIFLDWRDRNVVGWVGLYGRSADSAKPLLIQLAQAMDRRIQAG